MLTKTAILTVALSLAGGAAHAERLVKDATTHRRVRALIRQDTPTAGRIEKLELYNEHFAWDGDYKTAAFRASTARGYTFDGYVSRARTPARGDSALWGRSDPPIPGRRYY